MKCHVKGCVVAKCEGPDKLRRFESLDDLFDHLDNETILEVVNTWVRVGEEYNTLKERDEARKAYHRKHQTKQKLLAKLASEHLTPDEIEATGERAAEQIAERDINRIGKGTK